MQELKLVESTIGNEPVMTILARDLHTFFGSKQDFSTWIKKRIKHYGFVENEDFTICAPECLFGAKQGKIEYVLTESAATIICTRESSKKSRQFAKMLAARSEALSEILNALKDFDVPDDLPEMYVYAIRATESGRLKLGVSKNPELRLKQLQTANAERLELVAYVKAADRFKTEKVIHDKCSEHRIRGEWFNSEALGLAFAV